jgi:putative redox protein
MNEAPARGEQRAQFRTACGRELAVGRLEVGGRSRAIERITLSISRQSYDDETVWASLTPAEARRLAFWLLDHAARA